ncbi:bifunctional diguanylate cyclase/phosphodiesterase [Cryobacterium sp. HLT2-28]|uniref:putative bifunctional diguanylate cyclase/phosphodiesterase n=1 Tax=Cryobacterium sp. HLT2-28 TaxID=1259146 RepID=UPI00106C71EA|nr:EAL domain-containing protein [Cryobacterium sp. HLT2-28]TFB98644.1 EAL domain-containing protein [Cryobacterium sp. HLT2-28]
MLANTRTEHANVLPGVIGGSGGWPLWVLGVTLVSYVVGLMIRTGVDFSPLVDGWLGLLTVWVPVAVCCLGAWRTKFRRFDVLLASAAVTSFAVGDTYFVLATAGGVALPYPSLADIGFLGFYPLMLGALAVLAMRQIRGLGWLVILDSTVGSLGAAAVLAVLLDPMIKSALDVPGSPATAFAIAYPLFDLLLVSVFVGIGASQGKKIAQGWAFLVLGLVAFAATDVIYASLELNGIYVVGTPLDAGWALGLALIASWVDGEARSDKKKNPSAWSIHVQTVPTIATAASLGVLILGTTQLRISPLAVVPAALTLTLAALPLVFRQRIRIADAHRQARTDDLTGLPNRRAISADVPVRLSADLRRKSALMLLDLDKFKEVNDSLGHDVGDRLLIQVAARLSGQLRPTDLLARVGGDEFVIHLDSSGPDQAEAVALNLRAVLAQPFTLEGITVQASASIGIAIYPEQGEDLTVLMRKADMAMYKAKTTRSGHHIYRNDDDSHGEARLRTLEELRRALREDQLILHYQPKIDLHTGDVCGVEALVRWNHPTRGQLQPDNFIPLVEEGGLMHTMTQIVLEKALDQTAIWHAQGQLLTMAVNISASSLIDTALPERISSMVAARGLSPSVLVLEITEDFLMTDRDRARAILTRLRATGVRIAVDDFGTGYSSLAYLRDLPIDELKLDKSFVMPMAGNPRATALVVSTIDLAHSLGLRMVAEGVENSAAYTDLAVFGCDAAQGFFMSRPVPAAQLDEWFASRQEGPAKAAFKSS